MATENQAELLAHLKALLDNDLEVSTRASAGGIEMSIKLTPELVERATLRQIAQMASDRAV